MNMNRKKVDCLKRIARNGPGGPIVTEEYVLHNLDGCLLGNLLENSRDCAIWHAEPWIAGEIQDVDIEHSRCSI